MMFDAQSIRELSMRAYAMSTFLYPAAFRREYGEEMTGVFRDMVEESWRRHGWLGLAATWNRTAFDLAMSAGRQHLLTMRRRTTMLSKVRQPDQLFLVLVICFVVAAFGTPADPCSQVLLGLPLFGVYLCHLATASLPRAPRRAILAAACLNVFSVLVFLYVPWTREGVFKELGVGRTIVAMLLAPQLLVAVLCLTAGVIRSGGERRSGCA